MKDKKYVFEIKTEDGNLFKSEVVRTSDDRKVYDKFPCLPEISAGLVEDFGGTRYALNSNKIIWARLKSEEEFGEDMK